MNISQFNNLQFLQLDEVADVVDSLHQLLIMLLREFLWSELLI